MCDRLHVASMLLHGEAVATSTTVATGTCQLFNTDVPPPHVLPLQVSIHAAARRGSGH